ncbi:MAG: ABC transporter substrate-binding protein [Gammaproteobacteria bacterium]|nr:ABC transporter substrate-binding protein [Gammaproteobacteria bacterium]NIR96538.1 ABC transporter substrate-binding protein [Gammaproteobacteria bacterium]NIT62276.1 ABC transporter substrate-binding protein [Gammaproteobacteria bacterium]NIV19180.1 ABC transporter substrate-binding protein [Gammaproteobacteria bacterium]NIX10048.1 ABC transporter substrate-binding protein [Gammaproteobacteria bacterium]
MKHAALLLAGMAFAASATAAQGPLELVKATTESMLSALEANKQTIRDRPETLYDLVDEIVLPHFDFQAMARSVLGKYWRRASARQRERFVEEFRTLLVRTYASSLAEYSGQDVEYLPVRGNETADEVTVRTEIQQQSGFPIPVDYRLERTDAGWKVTDVVIDNLDLVLNYRTSFAQEIGRLGLDRVIENLAERNRQAAS